MKSRIARLHEVAVDAAVVTECLDCSWRYSGAGKAQPEGALALKAARSHARALSHRTIVHRSTEYRGSSTP